MGHWANYPTCRIYICYSPYFGYLELKTSERALSTREKFHLCAKIISLIIHLIKQISAIELEFFCSPFYSPFYYLPMSYFDILAFMFIEGTSYYIKADSDVRTFE